MTKNLVRFLATMLLLVTVPFAIAKEISFGIISTDSAAAQRDRWEPFFRDMEKRPVLL